MGGNHAMVARSRQDTGHGCSVLLGIAVFELPRREALDVDMVAARLEIIPVPGKLELEFILLRRPATNRAAGAVSSVISLASLEESPKPGNQ
jgi:hypothetical protein